MAYNAPINVRHFGAVGDGVTDDTAAIRAALHHANGKPIYFDGDFLVTKPLTGDVDAHFHGPGKITATSSLFETDGSITLRDLRITCSATVVSGVNVSRFVDYSFDGVSFDTCFRVLQYVIGGVAPYPPGAGIRSLNVSRCEFLDGDVMAIDVNAPIDDMMVDGCRFKRQKQACVYLSGAQKERQAAKQNIRITGNLVSGVRALVGNENAIGAFVVVGSKVNISNNIITDVWTPIARMEVWGIYTKSRNMVISGNSISMLSGSATNTIFIAIKGSHASGTGGGGLDIVVSDNQLFNDLDVFSIGVRMYGDRILAVGNTMQGVGRPFDHDPSAVSERNEIIGNVATNPPESHKTVAVDWRVAGGSYKVAQNVFEGYDDGIRVKTSVADVDLVELIDNTITANNDAYSVADSTSQGHVINKLIIRGGKASGQNLLRAYDDVVPNFQIDGVDVSGIDLSGAGGGYLLAFANTFVRSGSIRNLTDLSKSGAGAGTHLFLHLGVADETVVSLTYKATASTSTAAGYMSKEIRETWRRSGGTLAKQGSTTTVHEAKNFGDIDVSTAGPTLVFRFTTAYTAKCVADVDVQFRHHP